MAVFEMEDLIPALALDCLRPKELALTCSGFRSVNWDFSVETFDFVFGDGSVGTVHRTLAEFLSPKISRLRRTDASIDRYIFEDRSLSARLGFEALVSSLRQGTTLKVDASNFEALVRAASELENTECLSFLISAIDISHLNVEKALLLLRVVPVLHNELFQAGDLVGFIASHFHEISKERLQSLDHETACLILEHPSLKVLDEDSLYDFVRARTETDPAFAHLFESVYFEYLSSDRINDFASFAGRFLLGRMNACIWTRICQRLVRAPAMSGDPRANKQSVTETSGLSFAYNSMKPLDGIIQHLSREFSGNVHSIGVVEVIASSFYVNCEPENAARIGKDWDFYSQNKPDSWIRYDFKEMRVRPTSYSIRSYVGSPGLNHPKSWVFEVSNDGESWEVVDRRDDNSDLNDKYVIRNFPISPEVRGSFRFIRLRQTGENHAGDDKLVINSLEIFGTLFETF